MVGVIGLRSCSSYSSRTPFLSLYPPTSLATPFLPAVIRSRPSAVHTTLKRPIIFHIPRITNHDADSTRIESTARLRRPILSPAHGDPEERMSERSFHGRCGEVHLLLGSFATSSRLVSFRLLPSLILLSIPAPCFLSFCLLSLTPYRDTMPSPLTLLLLLFSAARLATQLSTLDATLDPLRLYASPRHPSFRRMTQWLSSAEPHPHP